MCCLKQTDHPYLLSLVIKVMSVITSLCLVQCAALATDVNSLILVVINQVFVQIPPVLEVRVAKLAHDPFLATASLHVLYQIFHLCEGGKAYRAPIRPEVCVVVQVVIEPL